MYRILRRSELASNIDLLEIEAADVARKAKPGQFVILNLHEKGERIPLTLSGIDEEKRTVTLVFCEVGKTSKQLGQMVEGDFIPHLAGPLGNPSEIKHFGRVLCVGGGVMIAPLYFQASALKKAGNKVVAVIGARNKDLLIYEREFEKLCDEIYVATDDGSKGFQGLDFLKELLKGSKIDRVVAMGPTIMMKTLSEITKPFGVKTIVALMPVMVDGMGMCGACRVTVGGDTKFGCLDGPEFDGHLVDFDELVNRQMMYLPEERMALLMHRESGGCGK